MLEGYYAADGTLRHANTGRRVGARTDTDRHKSRCPKKERAPTQETGGIELSSIPYPGTGRGPARAASDACMHRAARMLGNSGATRPGGLPSPPCVVVKALDGRLHACDRLRQRAGGGAPCRACKGEVPRRLIRWIRVGRDILEPHRRARGRCPRVEDVDEIWPRAIFGSKT